MERKSMFPILKHCWNIQYCVYWLTTPVDYYSQKYLPNKWMNLLSWCCRYMHVSSWFQNFSLDRGSHLRTSFYHETLVSNYFLKKKKLFEFSWIKGECCELSKQNKFKERKYFNLFRSEIYWMSYIQSSLLQPSIHIVKCINLYESILNEL